MRLDKREAFRSSAGHCFLCDFEASPGHRLGFEFAHAPVPRRKGGREGLWLCESHHARMDRSAGLQAALRSRQFHEASAQRASIDTRTLTTCLSKLEDGRYPKGARTNRERLQEIRSRFEMSEEDLPRYLIEVGWNAYAFGSYADAYDLARRVNSWWGEENPPELRLRLQVLLASCLRRLGLDGAASWLFRATAVAAQVRGVDGDVGPRHPLLRIAEAPIESTDLDWFGSLVSSLGDSNLLDRDHPKNRAYFAAASARLLRLSNTARAAELLRESIAESDAMDALHRRGNWAQTIALSGEHDLAASVLCDLADKFKAVSPFHEALASARCGVALLPPRIPLEGLDKARLIEARASFERTCEVLERPGAPEAPGLWSTARENAIALTRALGDRPLTQSEVEAARFHHHRSSMVYGTGPVLDHRSALPTRLVREPGKPMMLPSITDSGLNLDGMSALNWV